MGRDGRPTRTGPSGPSLGIANPLDVEDGLANLWRMRWTGTSTPPDPVVGQLDLGGQTSAIAANRFESRADVTRTRSEPQAPSASHNATARDIAYFG